VQGTCGFDTGYRGARLLVWLILNDRVRPSFIAGVRHAIDVHCVSYREGCVCISAPPFKAVNLPLLQLRGKCVSQGGGATGTNLTYTMFPVKLQAAGYATHMVGSPHYTPLPVRHLIQIQRVDYRGGCAPLPSPVHTGSAESTLGRWYYRSTSGS
jgi:hypothetical protein